MNSEHNERRWIILGLGAALVVGSGLLFNRLRHRENPAKSHPTTLSSSNADDSRREALARLCLESGGNLWKRAVFADPSTWLPLGRCPNPPVGAKGVWESQPEYAQYFEACLSDGSRDVRRTVRCVNDITPFCSAGVLHNSSRQSRFALVSASKSTDQKSEWQVEDVELIASWDYVGWTSNTWRVSNTGGRVRRVDTCVLEGTFHPKPMASDRKHPLPPSVSQRPSAASDEVPLLGEFGKMTQWNCLGTTVTVRNDEPAQFLTAHGCERTGFVDKGSEVTIRLSPRAQCQNIHSVLEWPKTTLSCEGNDLYIWLKEGKTRLRPNWWASVAK
jgi:hypothetical protein